MKKLAASLFLLSVISTLSAQFYRADMNPALEPFYHGVASGDPLTDRVIIWTRITLDTPVDPVSVTWVMATDTNLANIVGSGTATTDVTQDYTIKADVTGLQPDSWYYYQFEYNGMKSLIGRTHTMPAGNVDSIRLAIVSCSDYQNGYFNAYQDLAYRNDIDFVLHLGDYVYEYAASSSLADRNHEPPNEMITITDYRIRHSLYKLDPDLRSLHQQLPFITVWDDHETANDSWSGGAENHTEGTEGTWADRKLAGVTAYIEWMPIRQPNPADTFRIYREFNVGNLADIYMLDTRLEGRDEQVSNGQQNDPTRHIISPVQYNWLTSGILSSTAKWQILGQQVMMAPLEILGTPVNMDQWDGYNSQRDTLYGFLQNNNIKNTVVLTGDIHTSWANDLPHPGYNASTGANSIGVEFVTTSITSSNSPIAASAVVMAFNPHVKYVNLTNHGYYILDLNKTRAQADYYNVSTIGSHDYSIINDGGWYTLDGTQHLLQAPSPATGGIYPPLAPWVQQFTGINEPEDNVLILGAFPNPFFEQVVIQYHTYKPEEVTVTLTDMNGQVIFNQNIGKSNKGINYTHFDGSNLAGGMYIVTIHGKSTSLSQRLIKIK